MEREERESIEISSLNRFQRRVLGVLVEKGMTTPDAYPLTIKATTTGSNQKSNRDPVMSIDEDEVLDALEQLREMGLVAEVHTDGGRAQRYRHYLRHVFDWSEPQLAIMTELLLRGRQQLGELRSRAGRMKKTESLDHLRQELRSLMEAGHVQANGDLARRGIEVDHTWYTDREAEKMPQVSAPSASDEPAGSQRIDAVPTAAPVAQPTTNSPPNEADSTRLAGLERDNRSLREELSACQEDLESLRDEFRRLTDEFEDLRRALGG